jgi:hypothetical protein
MKTTVLSSTAITQLTAKVNAISPKPTRTTTGVLSGFASMTTVMVTGENYEPLKPLVEAISAKIGKHNAGNAKWAKDFDTAVKNARSHQGNGHDAGREHVQQA